MRVFWSVILVCAAVVANKETDAHDSLLNLAKKYLGEGETGLALDTLNDVLRTDENDYSAYFYRGTTYLTTGRYNLAISDFEQVIKIRPDFQPVYNQLGKLYVKIGDYESVIKMVGEYESFKDLDKKDSEFVQLQSEAKNLMGLLSKATKLFESKEYSKSFDILVEIYEKSPNSERVLKMKSDCLLFLKNFEKSVFDLERLANAQTDNRDTHLLLARIYYGLGDEERGLSHLQKCLHSDQEYKFCKAIYSKMKTLKNSFKTVNESSASTALLLEKREFLKTIRNSDELFVDKIYNIPDLFMYYENLIDKLFCFSSVKEKSGIQAINACKKAIKLFPALEILITKLAEAYQLEKDFESAVKVIEDGLKENTESTILKEALKIAKQKLNKSKQIDYYEVLQVDKSASKDEIRKAYRRLATQWHPDKNPDNLELAGKKMTQINLAYQILSDDEKKRLVDSGIDPENPEASQQHAQEQMFAKFFRQPKAGYRQQQWNNGFEFHF